MLIIGAKGFAKEVLEIIHQNNQIEHLAFYDDVNKDIANNVFGKFPVITNMNDAGNYFNKIDSRFTLGIGNPKLREKLYLSFKLLGGHLTSTISVNSEIGSFETKVGIGCNILPGAIISNGTKLGKGCIVYYNAMITHDCKLGDFVELSPGATVLGNVEIGNLTHVGANATILPEIKIGNNVIIGAGAVVNKNLPNNCVAVGVPAKIIKLIDVR